MPVVHPALKYSFTSLWSYLETKAAIKFVNTQRYGDLILYNYSNSCVYEKAWDEITILARGIIIDPPSDKIIALPFPKFFNYGEMTDQLPDEPFEVTEKLDGSLICIWHYKGEWHTSTRGSFVSDQAKWALNWLKRRVDYNNLHPDITYLAEAVYKENRIVVNYPEFEEGLYLLSAYNRLTGQEIADADTIRSVAGKVGFKKIAVFDYTFDRLLELAKTLKHDTEGFVVRFASGLRIKIKGDEYCRIHKLISACTPLGVWRILAAGDSIESVRAKLPEEFKTDFNKLVEILFGKFEATLAEINQGVELTKNMTDKELGIDLQWLNTVKLTEVQKRFIFAARKGELADIKTNPKHRLLPKIFDTFRPDGNALEGYEPASAVNRFAETT